ncbi:Cupredoxin [Chaetomium fimeti]|uniref:Cupredoxin n=1 Tax=Chaetomium fimeti TaxID=1854472 RepID=A0AAE0LPE1_9PEZI|nr:Cupredoxin [Chaetomium fimeti]
MLLNKFSQFLLVGWLSNTLAETVVHDDHFTPDHVLRVAVAPVISGCEMRDNVVVNGTSPGPAIHLLPGARTWIRVYNDIPDQNLTMHWHGLSQRFAPFSDGTLAASQWPIPPGHFFDYEIATELGDAGSYFYHSHVGLQALSCTGPLIVEDCGSSPYAYDDERILLFQDYFQQKNQDMVEGLTSVPYTWMGETRGIFLNGKGVALGMAATEGPGGEANGFFGSRRYSGSGAVNGSPDSWDGVLGDDQIQPSAECTLPVIDVEPGKTYRFRFIGATGLSLLSMGFEDHPILVVIQVDGGEYNSAVPVDRIQLGGGQRFDVILQTKTVEELGDKATYFLQFETRDRPETYRGYGVLRYNVNSPVPPAPVVPVLALPARVNDWLEYTLQPLDPSNDPCPTPEEVTRRVTLLAEEKQDPITGRLAWHLAHMTWTDESRDKPVLVDIYERGQPAIPDYEAAVANFGWDPANRLFAARKDEVLEIVIQNTGSQFSGAAGIVETHPFHAHGARYYDIGGGPGLYDADANNAKLAALNYKPIKRDTTMMYRYGDGRVAPGAPAGWRAWRMRMSHPGVWMVHCHVLGHMIMGMESLWVVGDAEDIITIPLPASENYFTYGGSVYGSEVRAPAVYHYFDCCTNKCVDARASNCTN